MSSLGDEYDSGDPPRARLSATGLEVTPPSPAQISWTSALENWDGTRPPRARSAPSRGNYASRNTNLNLNSNLNVNVQALVSAPLQSHAQNGVVGYGRLHYAYYSWALQMCSWADVSDSVLRSRTRRRCVIVVERILWLTTSGLELPKVALVEAQAAQCHLAQALV